MRCEMERIPFDEAFAEIRSVLHGAPSTKAFSRLTRVLERMTLEDQQKIDPRYLEPVHAWPAQMRTLPCGWVSGALEGKEVPYLELCAHFIPDHEDDWKFFGTPHAEHIRSLSLYTHNSLYTDTSFELPEGFVSCFESLEALTLKFESHDDVFLTWLRELDCPKNLRECSLVHRSVLVGPCRSTLEWILQPSLEVLRLRGPCPWVILSEVVKEASTSLRELHVTLSNPITHDERLDMEEELVSDLLTSPSLASLERLSLDFEYKRFTGRFDDDMLHVLEEAPCAQTLTHVSLKQHNLTEGGVARLRELPALVHLDVSGNNFDPTQLEPPEQAQEIISAECVPEGERQVLGEQVWRSRLERLRSWEDHGDSDITAFFVGFAALASVMHALFIGLSTEHPLAWWVSPVVSLPLLAMKMSLWPAWTQIIDWLELDEGSVPAHERRAVERRAGWNFLSMAIIYLGLFGLAAYLCVPMGMAHPRYAWLEAIWWTLGPGLLVAVFVLLFALYEWWDLRG